MKYSSAAAATVIACHVCLTGGFSLCGCHQLRAAHTGVQFFKFKAHQSLSLMADGSGDTNTRHFGSGEDPTQTTAERFTSELVYSSVRLILTVKGT